MRNELETINIIAAGDVLLGVCVHKIDGSEKGPFRQDPSSAFTHVAKILKEADIAFCNLEAPLSNQGKPVIGRLSAYRCSPRMAEGLTYAGFDLINLANNHTMDYGPDALVETLDILEKSKIPTIGAGRNIAEARKPVILERKGTRFGFLGYTTSENQPQHFAASTSKPGVAPIRISTLFHPPHTNEEDMEMMIEDIQAARSQADVLIVSCHWSVGLMGGSHTLTVHQPAVTRAAIDAGADLVIGHGPHAIQAVEVYKGKAIFYNLGNFVVDRDTPIKDSLLLKCVVKGKKIIKVSFLPVLINKEGQPCLLAAEDQSCAKIQKTMEKLSGKLGTKLAFTGAEGVVIA